MEEVVKKSVFKRVWNFYWEGFRNMSKWGKSLWIIILIKLFIFFVIIKFLFMPNFLNRNFKSDEERSRHVMEELTR